MIKAQNPRWNNAKFLLILFVVIGHTLQSFASSPTADGIVLFIYSFHMPAFIFFNGLFSKRTVDSRRFEKILPYLMLYFFMIFLQFLQSVLQHKKSFSFSILDDTKYSWYMLTLFFMYLIAMVLSKYEAKYILPLTLAAAVIAGYSPVLYSHYQLIGRVISFLPFFMLGYYLDEKRLDEITSKPAIRIIGALVLVGVFILILFKGESLSWLMKLFKGKFGYDDIRYCEAYGIFLKVLWYAVACVMSFCFIAVVPGFKTPLSAIGTRTLQIYAVHMPLNVVIMEVLGLKTFIENNLASQSTVIYIVYAVLITFILSLGFITPFFKLFFKIEPRKCEEPVCSEE